MVVLRRRRLAIVQVSNILCILSSFFSTFTLLASSLPTHTLYENAFDQHSQGSGVMFESINNSTRRGSVASGLMCLLRLSSCRIQAYKVTEPYFIDNTLGAKSRVAYASPSMIKEEHIRVKYVFFMAHLVLQACTHLFDHHPSLDRGRVDTLE